MCAAIEESNYMSRTSIYNKVEELNIQELEFEIKIGEVEVIKIAVLRVSFAMSHYGNL